MILLLNLIGWAASCSELLPWFSLASCCDFLTLTNFIVVQTIGVISGHVAIKLQSRFAMVIINTKYCLGIHVESQTFFGFHGAYL